MKGEGGLADATGTNTFGGGASMKQTSAVVNLTNIKEEDDEEKVGLGWGRGCVEAVLAAALWLCLRWGLVVGERISLGVSLWAYLSGRLVPAAEHGCEACGCLPPLLQGLWGIKGLDFKLPSWISGKEEEKK